MISVKDRRKKKKKRPKKIGLNDLVQLPYGIYEVYQIAEDVSGESEIRATKADFGERI